MAQGGDTSAFQDGPSASWRSDTYSSSVCRHERDSRGAGGDDRVRASGLAWGARSHCEPDCCSDDMQGQVERAAAVGRGGLVATLVGG